MDNSDLHLEARKFKHFNKPWIPHTIDRFASYANKNLYRYIAKWRDCTTEAVDSLHLPNAEWRRKQNWYKLPWELLDNLIFKLCNSGAEATVIAPYWPRKPWFILLSEISIETVDMPPETDLFVPQKQLGREGTRRSA
jgi:hypothetical protein